MFELVQRIGGRLAGSLQWWHVVVTYAPDGFFFLYIDGRLEWGGSVSATNARFSSRQLVELGDASSSIQFDSFRYYASVLAEADALVTYTNLGPASTPAYSFDDRTTTTTSCSGARWIERCGVRKLFATSFVGDTVTINGRQNECSWNLAINERFRMEHLAPMAIAEYRAGFDATNLYLFVVVQTSLVCQTIFCVDFFVRFLDQSLISLRGFSINAK